MKENLLKVYRHSMFRYLIIACAIVLVELVVFQFLAAGISVNYLIATILSMIVGIVLNWIFSRLFVFKTSKYSKKVEFSLVLIASLVGMGIQVLTVYVCVELLLLVPLVGKIIAIGITFFWNYFIRKRFIFSNPTASS